MSVKVVALAAVEDADSEAFVEAARRCVAASREESGVLRYDLWREAGTGGRFVFDEAYVDRAALDAHMAAAHHVRFAEAAKHLITTPPEIVILEAVDMSSA